MAIARRDVCSQTEVHVFLSNDDGLSIVRKHYSAVERIFCGRMFFALRILQKPQVQIVVISLLYRRGVLEIIDNYER